MVDTAISGLAAASAVIGANEFPINEAGASKKITGTQLKAIIVTAPVFAAGASGANTAPKLTSGTVNTTPEAGAIEYNGNTLYLSPEASNRGAASVEYYICLSSTNTLSNATGNQSLFDSVGAGTLTLPTGTYFFECLFSLSSMQTPTATNAAFDIKGTGGATLGNVLYSAVGIDGATATAAGQTGSASNASGSVASIVTGVNSANMQVHIQGTFSVSGAGTIIPCINLSSAAAAVVAVGSYFRCHPVFANAANTVGQWS